MDKETLRKAQLTMLEIGKEIKRVCDENNISYFLDSGTLLGAVRHEGFVPWDDDMDIGMLRTDYDRFLAVAPEKLNSQYELVTWENDEYYGHAFAKVQKKGTVWLENMTSPSKAKHGIYVDVFPYDSYPDDVGSQRKLKFELSYYKTMIRAKSHYCTWKENNGTNIKKYLLYIPFRIMCRFYSRKKLIGKYNGTVEKYRCENTEYMYAHCASTIGNWLIPAYIFDNFTEHDFEDDVFSVPSKSHDYLVSAYGDYMTPLPPEKRYDQHQIIEYKF